MRRLWPAFVNVSTDTRRIGQRRERRKEEKETTASRAEAKKKSFTTSRYGVSVFLRRRTGGT